MEHTLDRETLVAEFFCGLIFAMTIVGDYCIGGYCVQLLMFAHLKATLLCTS